MKIILFLLIENLNDMKNLKTTLAGILQFVALLASQAASLFDNDTMTNPDYSLIVTSLLILFGLVQASDKK